MKTLAFSRSRWLVLALLAGSWFPSARASDPSVTTTEATHSVVGDPEATSVKALEFERKKNWAAAIQVYQDAGEQWPSRQDFRQRRRLCEIHLRLARRYQDQSFRNVLLRLSREKSFDLFDEMIEKIESHYVDPVSLAPLVRRGLDNLEVALRDPSFTFLRLNAPDASPSRLNWLREQLRLRRDRLAVTGRDSARDEVFAACELARQAIGLNPAPVVLEFIFGTCDVLDDYTTYLTPDKLDDMFAMIDGNFVGLGVELKLDDEGLKLVGVIRGGPASDAGLKAGDRIVAVGGKSVRGLGLDEAAGRLQGNEGTSIEISILRTDRSTHEPPPDPSPRRGRERGPGQDRRTLVGRRLHPVDRVPEDLGRGTRPRRPSTSKGRGCAT